MVNTETSPVAEQSELARLYKRGLACLNGDGVPKDQHLAAELIFQAASDGYADAQFLMGALHQQGIGVAADVPEAVNWYLLAAGQGHRVAQFNLGYAYETGEGIKKSLDRAIHWYRQAAKNGDEDAMAALDEIGAPVEEPVAGMGASVSDPGAV